MPVDTVDRTYRLVQGKESPVCEAIMGCGMDGTCNELALFAYASFYKVF